MTLKYMYIYVCELTRTRIWLTNDKLYFTNDVTAVYLGKSFT